MTNIAVKGAGSLMDVSIASKSNVQSENGTESFDETLNCARKEKSDKNSEFEAIGSKNSDDNKTDRFEKVNRKNQIKPEDEITDEQMAAVSEEVICQMKEMLMEKYNISEEQLAGVIEELGLSEQCMLNVKDLTQIVMKLEGISSQADMLTNPDFAKNVKEVLSALENVKENVKPEDFQIEQLNIETESTKVDEDVSAVVQDVPEDVVATEEVKVSADDVETDDAVKDTNQVEKVVIDTDSVKQNGEKSDEMLKHGDKQSSGDEAKNSVDISTTNIGTQDFVQKLTEDLSNKVGEAQANDIVRQVVYQTQLQVKQGVTSLEMQLYPEHLGKVLVQVVSNEGSITAQITAESEAAKAALEGQLTLLKENLNNQGVKVENVEVTIASHAFEQSMQGERNGEQSFSQSKKSRRNTDMFFDTVSDDQIEESNQTIMELKGSTVSYTA